MKTLASNSSPFGMAAFDERWRNVRRLVEVDKRQECFVTHTHTHMAHLM